MHQPTNSTIPQAIFGQSISIYKCFGKICTVHVQKQLFLSF